MSSGRGGREKGTDGVLYVKVSFRNKLYQKLYTETVKLVFVRVTRRTSVLRHLYVRDLLNRFIPSIGRKKQLQDLRLFSSVTVRF